MIGSLTVYFNTGFNGVDIPASPSVLTLAQSKSYPNVYFTREDIDKPFFDVADTYDNLKNVDYLAYTSNGGTSYYFASPSSLAQGVTRLFCDLDALLTMGGAANLTYSGGWQERGHIKKEEDTLFSNVASEDWMPSQPLNVSKTGSFGAKQDTDPADVDIVISSVDLFSLGLTGEWTQTVIEGVVSGEEDAAMYFPAIPVVTEGTIYGTYDYFIDNAYETFAIPASAAFNYADSAGGIRRGVKKLYSAGQLQLQASYKVPGEYLAPGTEDLPNPNYTDGKPGQINQIRGCNKEYTASSMPFEYTIDGYTIKNKKVFTTYRQYVITNLGSSDSCVKAPEELYDGTNAYPSLLVWADPTSTGKPYARFKYIKDNPLQYADAVKGLQWNSNQIMMEGASGSLWNSIGNAFQNSTLNRQAGVNRLSASYASQIAEQQIASSVWSHEQQTNRGISSVVKEGLGAVFNIAGGNIGKGSEGLGRVIGTGIGVIQDVNDRNQQLNMQTLQAQTALNQAQAVSASNLAQIQQAINENKVGLLRNNNLVTPTLLFTPEQNLGLYGYNYFVLYEVRKTDEDLKSEDEYYQRFGYNGLHRPLTADCFNAREYYSYVQAFNINIKSEYGLRIRAKAISQLNSGVRVWKVLPDASYYDVN